MKTYMNFCRYVEYNLLNMSIYQGEKYFAKTKIKYSFHAQCTFPQSLQCSM
jgi:hypothetical protein